jgi:hypothetical protein
MFISLNNLAFLSSFLGYRKARTAARKKQKEGTTKCIERDAHTDYRITYDRVSKEWILCFGACIRLKREDIECEFFNEDSRAGITRARIHGDGSIKFDEEDVQLNTDDYVFAEHPKDYHYNPFSHRDTSTFNGGLLEMV